MSRTGIMLLKARPFYLVTSSSKDYHRWLTTMVGPAIGGRNGRKRKRITSEGDNQSLCTFNCTKNLNQMDTSSSKEVEEIRIYSVTTEA